MASRDQLAAWRAAIASQRADQRRNRWRRPDPQPSGYQVPAPDNTSRRFMDTTELRLTSAQREALALLARFDGQPISYAALASWKESEGGSGEERAARSTLRGLEARGLAVREGTGHVLTGAGRELAAGLAGE